MKKFKHILTRVRDLAAEDGPQLNELLWELILYSPKIPVRPHQQQVLDEAGKFTLKIRDEYLTHTELTVNGFKWGTGKTKILLTHGWASKAADFSELITALRKLNDVTLYAFDVPGNGSSEAELSHLLLYINAVKATMQAFGQPDILIGHSLGCMANVAALQQAGNSSCSLMISLAPLIRLEENFVASMDAVQVSSAAKNAFMEHFKAFFKRPASDLNLDKVYVTDDRLKHWLAYDEEDTIAPHAYLEEFLQAHPSITAVPFNHTGHDKLLRDPAVIAHALHQISSLTV
jgi:pimeloyl-ACP methyl ester carboxylesterase